MRVTPGAVRPLCRVSGKPPMPRSDLEISVLFGLATLVLATRRYAEGSLCQMVRLSTRTCSAKSSGKHENVLRVAVISGRYKERGSASRRMPEMRST